MSTVTALPSPPSRADPVNFSQRGDEFLGALPTFATELNTVAGEVNTNATNAINSASSALASTNTAQAAANFKGSWSTLTGAVSRPASVYHSSKYWMLLPASLANIATSEPGVTADWAEIGSKLPTYTYANRNNIRSLSPAAGEQLIVETLGLFVYYAGSTEIDDDETCFATASGRWLLEGASFDTVANTVSAATDPLHSRITDLENPGYRVFQMKVPMTLLSMGVNTFSYIDFDVPGGLTSKDQVLVSLPSQIVLIVSGGVSFNYVGKGVIYFFSLGGTTIPAGTDFLVTIIKDISYVN